MSGGVLLPGAFGGDGVRIGIAERLAVEIGLAVLDRHRADADIGSADGVHIVGGVDGYDILQWHSDGQPKFVIGVKIELSG